jgi:hypothetical protein
MTFPDPSLERPLGRPETAADNVQDVIPPTERNKDPQDTSTIQGLTLEGSRPLTDDERKAADRDPQPGERVYAPASERVPKEPVPGHREVIERTDTHTREREAIGQAAPTSTESPGPTESAFTRVARPTTGPGFETPTPGAYASPMSNPGFQASDMHANQPERRRKMFFGVGFSWFTLACSGVGLWLFMRWRRERNKPINRIRRQARQAASEVRGRVANMPMPTPEEAARPAMGLSTAILSILVILWQQSQARSRRAEHTTRRAVDTLSDLDWQHRLMKLKERWNPGRLELEKISISRH